MPATGRSGTLTSRYGAPTVSGRSSLRDRELQPQVAAVAEPELDTRARARASARCRPSAPASTCAPTGAAGAGRAPPRPARPARRASRHGHVGGRAAARSAGAAGTGACRAAAGRARVAETSHASAPRRRTATGRSVRTRTSACAGRRGRTSRAGDLGDASTAAARRRPSRSRPGSRPCRRRACAGPARRPAGGAPSTSIRWSAKTLGPAARRRRRRLPAPTRTIAPRTTGSIRRRGTRTAAGSRCRSRACGDDSVRRAAARSCASVRLAGGSSRSPRSSTSCSSSTPNCSQRPAARLGHQRQRVAGGRVAGVLDEVRVPRRDRAPPIRWPLSPHASSIRPAPSSWSGFLKTLPNVRLFVGCVALRCAWSSATVALISSGGRGARRNSTCATTCPGASAECR